jgi:hypothetical protein
VGDGEAGAGRGATAIETPGGITQDGQTDEREIRGRRRKSLSRGLRGVFARDAASSSRSPMENYESRIFSFSLSEQIAPIRFFINSSPPNFSVHGFIYVREDLELSLLLLSPRKRFI